jgi:tRNA A-37 threonylcarbamoyl transferase component Bud32
MAALERLGKYEIRRELGRGAMGVVYEAFDPLIKRSVALKTIRTDQLESEQGQDVIARFRHEAQAAGRLAHPNIVAIYDFGEEAGVWYIAMEFLKGRELKDYFLTNERFTSADIVRIMTQILAALGYAHRQGVVHRDIKPANVVVIEDGTVKVADFGIAHIETSNMTQAGAVLGTPAYMSPEQILGLPVDGRSDLFSAGVILYQFLTGERPFSGSSTATMHKVLEEEPLPPSRFNVQVPGAMDAVVRKALAKRPEDRYQSADEFAAAIAAAMAAQRPVADETVVAPAEATVVATAAREARRDTTRAAGPAPAAPAPAAAEVPAAPPSGRKAPVGLIAIGGGLAVAAIVAGVWFVQQRSGADAPKVAQAPAASVPAASAPAASAPPAAATASAASAPAPVAPGAPPPKTAPGLLTISAVGLVDPKDPRYGSDKTLLQTDLRADSKAQLVEKALGLMLESGSLAKNYDVLRDKLLAQSGSFIATTVREGEPRTGKDGLVSMTTEAVVNVKALQKSLNEMSRDQRIQFIRAGGDPKISVAITVRDADAANAQPQPSPVAENLLKERIKSFGFRTWSDDAGAAAQRADFAVQGEAQIRKLSLRLEASGVVITKYALTSWTVKCVDRDTGEEIYFNTTLPKGVGSWASEGEALQAIGTKIADQFSRDFFLQHLNVTGRKVTLTIAGLPAGTAADEIGRELLGLPAVIAATPASQQEPRVYELQVGGSGSEGDLVARGILKPLNAQLGQACFTLGSVAGDRVAVTFDRQLCGDAAVLSRLETNPPAGLYGAPPGRQKAVIRDPETLRRLTI